MPTSPYGSAFGTFQTAIGIAKETTRGTPVAPSLWIPTRDPKYKPDRMFIPAEDLQGSAVDVYSETPGPRYDSHGWDGYPYFDTFPALIGACLGSPDGVGTAPASTTLAAAATAGATTISTTATLAVGTFFTLGSAANGNIETHKVKTVSDSGPFTVTPTTSIVYNQSNGSAVTGLTKHVFSLLNQTNAGYQPPSWTVTDFDGDQWRQLAAGQFGDLTMKATSTTLVDYTSTWFCNPSITPSTPTVSTTSLTPPPGWTTSIVIGTNQDFAVESWEIDFKRNTKPLPAMTGTQQYFEYFADKLVATCKFTVINTTGAPELTQFENGVQLPIDFLFYDVTNGYAMEVHSSQALYTTGSLDRNKEYVEATLDLKFIPSAADATAGGVSPVQVTIANAVTTPYQ